MLEALSLYSDELMTILLEEQEPPLDLVLKIIREATIAQQIAPVLMGTAYKNKGVQPLLDAVTNFLPSPLDRDVKARDNLNEQAEVVLEPDDDKPMVAMAFKLVEEPFGQVTYMRIYQGTLKKGEFYYNTRSGKRARVSRILRVHSDEREDIDAAGAGDIVAVMGIDCATGDTFCSEGINYSLESIYAAEPVIDLSIIPNKRADYDKLSKALNRFMREDPTFRVHVDQETSETIISGMGELHLEIYVERIRREYKVDCTIGQPKVSYREAPTEGDALQLHPQEADRRLGPVRQGRRQARPAGGALRGPLRVREQRHRRPDPRRVHPGHREGLPPRPGQGPAGRLRGHRRQDGPRRRRLPRRRLLGHGLRDLRLRRLPRDLPQGRPGPARADHEGRGRVPDRVPGPGLRPGLLEARDHHQHRDPRGLRRDLRRGPALRRCSATPTTSAP